jgi:hypothetical protein
MRPAILRLLLALATVLLLGSCVGRQAVLLPAGSGQGKYSGEFQNAAGASIGTFNLRIEDSGALRGSGDLDVYGVSLRGVLTTTTDVVAYITDEATQRTGKFNGKFAGGALSGTWEFDPTGTQTIQGTWTAALNP